MTEVKVLPAEVNLTLYRADKPQRWALKLPFDLTGASVRMMVRSARAGGKVLCDFSDSVELGIEPNAPEPGVTRIRILEIPTAEADEWATVGTGFYDLQVTYPNGDVATYLRGKAKLLEDITHDRD